MIIRTVRHIIAIGAALGLIQGGLDSCSDIFAAKSSAATRSEDIDTVENPAECPGQLLAMVGSRWHCNVRWPFVPPSDGSAQANEHALAGIGSIGPSARLVPEGSINAYAGVTRQRWSNSPRSIGHRPYDRLTTRHADGLERRARPVAHNQPSASERAAERIAREQAARDRVAAERIAKQQEEINRREVKRIQREQAELNRRVSARIALEQSILNRLAGERITRQQEAANRRAIEAIRRQQQATSVGDGTKEPEADRLPEAQVRRKGRFARVLRRTFSILRSVPLAPADELPAWRR